MSKPFDYNYSLGRLKEMEQGFLNAKGDSRRLNDLVLELSFFYVAMRIMYSSVLIPKRLKRTIKKVQKICTHIDFSSLLQTIEKDIKNEL